MLVLEKGPFVPPEAVSGDEQEAFSKMYEKAGLLASTDGAFGILAGACLGGGSTINWACCLPPPLAIREEWADPAGAHRLPQFATPNGDAPSGRDDTAGPNGKVAPDGMPSAGRGTKSAPADGAGNEFEASLAAVMGRIGATTEGVTHNGNNRALIEGLEKLGYGWKTTAQNLKDTAATSAGWTCFGEKTPGGGGCRGCRGCGGGDLD